MIIVRNKIRDVYLTQYLCVRVCVLIRRGKLINPIKFQKTNILFVQRTFTITLFIKGVIFYQRNYHDIKQLK